MRVRLPLLLVVVALAVVGATSGCGSGADRDRVRAVSVRFLAALASRQGDAACAQLSTALRMTVVQSEHGQRCADAVVKLTTGAESVTAVRVYATSARVDLSGGESVFLGEMRHGWRIEALGCRPRPSGPYACEQRA